MTLKPDFSRWTNRRAVKFESLAWNKPYFLTKVKNGNLVKFGCVQRAHNTKSLHVWCNVNEFRQKRRAFLWCFGAVWEVVIRTGGMLYTKQICRAYTSILMAKKIIFHVCQKNRPSTWNTAEIGFGGLWTGRKQRGRCLRARTVKTNPKTTPTLRHMLNFHRFAIDW